MILRHIIRLGRILPAIAVLAGCYSMDLASNSALDGHGEKDSRHQNRKPGDRTEAERFSEQHKHHREQQKYRIGVWVLEEARLTACHNEPSLRQTDPAQQK